MIHLAFDFSGRLEQNFLFAAVAIGYGQVVEAVSAIVLSVAEENFCVGGVERFLAHATFGCTNTVNFQRLR